MLSKVNKTKDLSLYLGVLGLCIWIVDSYTKIFVQHAPYRMLWLSSAGLLMLAIGLIIRSGLLITAMFYLMVIPESLWIISFFASNPNFPRFEFAVTLYHFLLIPLFIVGLTSIEKVSKFGWLAAAIFGLLLGLTTYIVVHNNDNVNCIFTNCIQFFTTLYKIENPLRIFIGVGLLTVFMYIPLNIMLFYAKRDKSL